MINKSFFIEIEICVWESKVMAAGVRVLREEAVRTLRCVGRRWCRQWVLLDMWPNNRLSAVVISSSMSKDVWHKTRSIVAVQGGDEWRKDMKQAFNELVLLVRDEHTVSAYELGTSGLVQALFSTLSVSDRVLFFADDIAVCNWVVMSVSILNLYSALSWSISNALGTLVSRERNRL